MVGHIQKLSKLRQPILIFSDFFLTITAFVTGSYLFDQDNYIQAFILTSFHVGSCYLRKEYNEILRNLNYTNRIKSSVIISSLVTLVAFVLNVNEFVFIAWVFLTSLISYHVVRFLSISALNFKNRGLNKIVLLGTNGLNEIISIQGNVGNEYQVNAIITGNEKLVGRLYNSVPIVDIEDIDNYLDNSSGCVISFNDEDKINLEKSISIKHKFEAENKFVKVIEKSETLAEPENTMSFRDFDFMDLMNRPQNFGLDHKTKEMLRGKSILITGAAGSIGSELFNSLLKTNFKCLVLADHNEFDLFKLQTLAHRKLENIFFKLGDLKEQSFVEEIFNCYEFDIIFHCAAYKHVSFVEQNPRTCVKNNIVVTQNSTLR